MTISRIRPPGAWLGIMPVASEEFEHIDKYLSEAIHGKGGTYSLTTELIIGGDDVTVTESLEVGGNFSVAGDVFIGDDLEVAGNIGVDGGLTVTTDLIVGDDVQIAGGLQVAGSAIIDQDLTVNDDAHVVGSLVVDGGGLFDGTFELLGTVEFAGLAFFATEATFNGDVDANGNVYLGSALGVVEFHGNTTHHKRVMYENDGKQCYRQQVVSVDGNTTVLAARVDTVHVPAGVFSASREMTIDDTGAADGMRIKFQTEDLTFGLTVRKPGGLAFMSLGGPSLPQLAWAERVNGVWYGHHGSV